MQMEIFPYFFHHTQIKNVRWNVHESACILARMTEKPGNWGGPRSIRWDLSRISGYWFILHDVYDPFLSRLGRVLITWMGNGHVIRNSDSKICERKAYWKGCYPMLRCYSNELSNWAPAVPTSDYRYWLAVPLIVLIHIAFFKIYTTYKYIGLYHFMVFDKASETHAKMIS